MATRKRRFLLSRHPVGAGGDPRLPLVSLLGIALTGLLFSALPVLARQSSATAAEPSFLIEKIVVENREKFSAGIIIAESLLQEGGSYTETELRDAVYRIVRLPLILDAEFSLRRGSERGRYELVITVWETRRWFFGATTEVVTWDRPISVNGLSSTRTTESGSAVAGRRFSIGRYGVFFLAAGGEGTLQLGYTHYNLFGRSGFLNLGYSISDCAEERRDDEDEDAGDDGCRTEIFGLGLDPGFSTWSSRGDVHRTRISLGIPIRGNHSLRFLMSYRTSDFGLRRPAHNPTLDNAFFFEDRKEIVAQVSWVYNSIDDPVFPTTGLVLESGMDYRTLESRLTDFRPQGGLGPTTLSQDSSTTRLSFSGQKYWPVSEVQTLSSTLRASVGSAEVRNLPLAGRFLVSDDPDVWQGDLTLGYSQFLWRVAKRPRWRELRWENEIVGFFDGTSPDFEQPENPRSGFRVGSGLALRTTWGVFRLKLSYLDAGGG